jgi:hypothetical protein
MAGKACHSMARSGERRSLELHGRGIVSDRKPSEMLSLSLGRGWSQRSYEPLRAGQMWRLLDNRGTPD